MSEDYLIVETVIVSEQDIVEPEPSAHKVSFENQPRGIITFVLYRPCLAQSISALFGANYISPVWRKLYQPWAHII